VSLLGITIQKDCLNLIFPSIESDDFTLFIRDCTFKEVGVFEWPFPVDAELYAKPSSRSSANPRERDYSSRYQTAQLFVTYFAWRYL